jgi:hypothetical protein
MHTRAFKITIFLERRNIIKTKAVNMFTQLIVDWSAINNRSYAKGDSSISETYFSSLSMLFCFTEPEEGNISYHLPQFRTEYRRCVAPEVLTAVTAKSTIFWDVTACSRVEVGQRFEGEYCFRNVRALLPDYTALQSQKITLIIYLVLQ